MKDSQRKAMWASKNMRGVPRGIEPIEPSTMKDVLDWSPSDYRNWKNDLYGDDSKELEEFARMRVGVPDRITVADQIEEAEDYIKHFKKEIEEMPFTKEFNEQRIADFEEKIRILKTGL